MEDRVNVCTWLGENPWVPVVILQSSVKGSCGQKNLGGTTAPAPRTHAGAEVSCRRVSDSPPGRQLDAFCGRGRCAS